MTQLPHSIEAEEQLLGAMLVYEPAVSQAIEGVGLRPEDFYYRDRHGLIFAAIADLYGAGTPCDTLTVTDALPAEKLKEIGGADFVSSLAEKVNAPGNASYHAEIVQRHALARKAADWSDSIGKAVAEGDLDLAGELATKIPRPESDSIGRSRPRLYSIADLASLPEPRYLVQDFIRAEGTNALFGPSGSGKSFLALDWNLCVAAGLPFYGQAVEQAPVVYVAGEGLAGAYNRIEAWCQSRGVEEPSDFHIWPEAVNFFAGETAQFEAAIAALDPPPGLITIDTMARCMVGGEENSAKDTGLFIDNAERVARHVGAALLNIHHTGKNGELERGSSALRGAVDTLLKLSPDGSGLKLTCEKQKDAAEFEAWKFHLAEQGKSAVIRPGGAVGRFSEQEQTILETVPASFGTDWVSATKIIEVSGIPKTTFYRSLKSLVDRGLIEERQAGKQRKEYRLADVPETVPNLPKLSPGQPETVPSHPPFLRVGQGQNETGTETGGAR